MDVGRWTDAERDWGVPVVGAIAAGGGLAAGGVATALGGPWTVAVVAGVVTGAVLAAGTTTLWTMVGGPGDSTAGSGGRAVQEVDATPGIRTAAEGGRGGGSDIETRLRTQRDRFAALFENIPDPVVYYRIADREDGARVELQAANPAFERVHERDALSVVGESLFDVVAPDGDTTEREAILESVANGDAAILEVPRRTPDGIRRFLVRHTPASTSPPYEYGFALAVDVTERERRERRLAVINRVLRHDLRTEVNLISGAADTIVEAEDPDARAQAAEMLRTHTNRLATIGEKARYVDRLVRDPDADLTVVDAADVASRAVENADDHGDARISLDVEQAPVEAGELLDVAVEELVENALLHVENPSVTVTVRDRGEYVTIAVADDGTGIPDTELSALDRDRETQLEHGSGIGLRLVRWIVSDAGGDVEIETTDGTTVTLLLPPAEQ